MSILANRHLDAVAWRLAQSLPGVDPGGVFLGTRDGLTAELGRLFDERVFGTGEGSGALSYREALSARIVDTANEGTDMALLLRRPLLRFYIRTADADELARRIAITLPPDQIGSVRTLSMGGGLALVASLEAAGTALAMPEVDAWQVPGDLTPLGEATTA